MRKYFFIQNIFISALVASLGSQAIASSKKVNATVGVRLGDDVIESYIDFISPIYQRENTVAFINPRFSLHDESENEFNLGLGYRHLFPEKNVILGSNVFFDTRRTKNSKRFNQMGLGFEILSKKIDFRANFYKPENGRTVIAENNTVEESINVETSSTTTLDGGSTFHDPYASVHSIFQDVDTAGTISTSTLTTTTTTSRFFEQFESALKGYDAEIGYKLPLPSRMPETKLFAGYYDYRDDFGNSAKGSKARLEVRSGSYLAFDLEVFDDDTLNKSDYFIGGRLNIPFDLADIAAGKNSFRGLKSKLSSRDRKEFKERLATEMVMRDVRIQTHESEFIERADKATVDVQKTLVETEEATSVRSTLEIANNITFVDGDNTGTQDGTAENPYSTLTGGIANAGNNNTIFLQEVSSGAGAYDEHVTLQANQTLTSSISARGGNSYSTTNKPRIQPTTQGIAVTLSENTAINRIDITTTFNGSEAIFVNLAAGTTGAVSVTNNTTTTSGRFSPGVGVNNLGSSDVTVSSNNITSNGLNSWGILTVSSGNLTVNNNTVTTISNGSDAINTDNDGSGSTTISSNTITTTGIDAQGISTDNDGSGATTISNNNVTTMGEFADAIDTDNNSSSVTTISSNTVSTTGNEADGIDTSNDGTANTVISNNTITVTGTDSQGIDTDNEGNGTTVTTTISDNNVTSTNSHGIDDEASSNACLQITGNTVAAGGDAIIVQNAVDISAADEVALQNDNTLNGGSTNINAGVTYGVACP